MSSLAWEQSLHLGLLERALGRAAAGDGFRARAEEGPGEDGA